MLLSRRKTAQVLFGGAVASLLAACQSSRPAPPPTSALANPLIKPRTQGAALTPVLANSDLAVGTNRFALGLLDAGNQPVSDGSVLVEFFKLAKGNQNIKRGEATADFRTVGAASKGIWVARTSFDEAGSWNAQVTLQGVGGPPLAASRLNLEVLDRSVAPGYGDRAPRSVSVTERDVNGDVSHICSASPPCAMHSISIDRALDGSSKPLAILFATPALCTSALCAPQLDNVEQLRTKYGSQVNFVHVDIYQYPFDGTRVVQAVTEWRLPSDPWTFIVDHTGAVKDRFEGPAPFDELDASLKTVLS